MDNQVNLGFGLNYEFHEDERGVAFAEGGFYFSLPFGQIVARGAGLHFPPAMYAAVQNAPDGGL